MGFVVLCQSGEQVSRPAAVVLLWACTTGVSAEPWDTGDRAFGSAALVLTLADWRQTHIIAKEPHKWGETNSALGKHPSVGRVNGYFVGSLAVGSAAAQLMPPSYRKGFLAGVAAVEFNMVARGYTLGMRMGF